MPFWNARRLFDPPPVATNADAHVEAALAIPIGVSPIPAMSISKVSVVISAEIAALADVALVVANRVTTAVTPMPVAIEAIRWAFEVAGDLRIRVELFVGGDVFVVRVIGFVGARVGGREREARATQGCDEGCEQFRRGRHVASPGAKQLSSALS